MFAHWPRQQCGVPSYIFIFPMCVMDMNLKLFLKIKVWFLEVIGEKCGFLLYLNINFKVWGSKMFKISLGEAVYF